MTDNKIQKKPFGSYQFREADVPQAIEVTDKKGFVKWGKDNLYPQFLFKLAYEEPIHGGIINSKVTFITSGGLKYKGSNPVEFDNAMKNGLNSYTLKDIIEGVAFDNEVCNGFCYYFKKKADGIWYLEPMDFELIRKSEDSNAVFYYSEDWSASQQTEEKTGYKEIKSINAIDENTLECIMYVSSKSKQYVVGNRKKKTLTQNYYPVPTYSGAISSIMANEEMNFFHYSEVINGFKGGTLLSLNNGIPDSVDEENKIIKQTKGEATDRNKQGGLAITFSDGKEREPTVVQLNGNNLDSRYLLTQEHLSASIFVAHSIITPALFGVKTAGQLGSTQELLTGYLVFKDSYARKRMSQLTEPLTYALKELNGFTGTIELDDYIPEYLAPQEEETVSGDQMKSEEPTVEEVLKAFEACGKDRNEFEFIGSRELQIFEGLEQNEEEYIQEMIKNKFANGLSDLQSRILQMINGGESYQAIKTANEISAKDLTKQILQLKIRGFVDQDNWELTDSGKRSIQAEQKLSVVYTYELRPDAPKLVKGGESREFCSTLIGLNRVYTREEINQISAGVNRNVWLFRGGWYHNPETNNNTPSCRHYWKQNVIIDN